MDAKARKRETDLKSLGMGVMLFGAWTFIKLAVTFLMYGIQFDEVLSEEVMTAGRIIIWVILALAFLIRLYIGISARSESDGKRKRAFYLVLAGLVVAVDAAAIVAEIVMLFTGSEGILSMAITVLIDATSTVILIELMVNAIAVRKLRKKEAAA